MADILIKNMVLPTEDEQVNITILSDGSVIEHFRNESGKWSSYRSGGVTAIELPEHGRLIDADGVIKNLDKYYCMECDNWNGIRCKTCDHYWAMEVLEDAPTVLEASDV